MDSPNDPQPLSNQEPSYPEAKDGLLLDSDGIVKSGTLKALVERLTSHEIADPDYSKVFLATFKSFTTLDELFKLLVDRFQVQQSLGLTPEQKATQERVISTFESMVTDGDILEKEDMYILDRIKAFALSEDATSFPAAKNLVAVIEQATQRAESAKIVPTNTAPRPSPIYPNLKANQKLNLLDIEPLELARQLTLLESSLYQRVRRVECLQRAQQNQSMDGIGTVIQTSNRIADWVANSVMSSDAPHQRAIIVKTSDQCR
ncbi:cell division control protein [Moniliophthora roreri]|uniref:N-terminal Ras-GEF domain-containing protein n=1 Tax=Moniliophthora roreri TaxID=221103 RepID=A0A0W0FYP6_MONRR|nr:cell division control protein [Moniliophthora roreri]